MKNAGAWRTGFSKRRVFWVLIALGISLLFVACGRGHRSGIPADAQAVINEALADVDAGRYDKLYQEGAEEWRNSATLDDSKAAFKTARDKLGAVRSRNLLNAREEQTSTAPVPGHSIVVVYQTSFERGSGMETLTLLEHDGRWYLARYFVSSSALAVKFRVPSFGFRV